MDLSKSAEFFNPTTFKDRIHIIGLGSVGSTVAELLSRFGFTKVSLYDFDIVQEHNLANQMFTTKDILNPKLDAVCERWVSVNPEAKDSLVVYPDGWNGQKLSGYVFLCVDNIDLRRRIVKENQYNDSIKGMFDFRTGLTDAQHYAADWSSNDDIKALLDTMDFTHEEAEKNVPMSACKVALCVMPTVWSVAMAGVTNFINLLKGKKLERAMITKPFDFETIVF